MFFRLARISFLNRGIICDHFDEKVDDGEIAIRSKGAEREKRKSNGKKLSKKCHKPVEHTKYLICYRFIKRSVAYGGQVGEAELVRESGERKKLFCFLFSFSLIRL